jgi:transposase
MVACETGWNNATARTLPGDPGPGPDDPAPTRGRSRSVSSNRADATRIKDVASHNRRMLLIIHDSERGEDVHQAETGDGLGHDTGRVHVTIRYQLRVSVQSQDPRGREITGRALPDTGQPSPGRLPRRAAPLDALIPDDHPARTVWAYVEGLDLAPLYDRIRAVERGPGRDAIDPEILNGAVALRRRRGRRRLDALCREHAAFQWIAGDVSTDYHTLADFRTDHLEFLDGLLTAGVAALVAEGLVDLNRVAQDEMRVRASAGATSFRRRPTPEEALAQAEAQVEALRAEVAEGPAASDRRERGPGSGRRGRRTRRGARRPTRKPR